jgi:hypothetical protein
MQQTVGLFSDQKKAEKAVAALATANLGESTIRTIEEWSDELDVEFNVAAAPNPDAGMVGLAAPSSPATLPLRLNDEQVQFFRRSLMNGGVLVVVEVADDAYYSRAKRILKDQGGLVAGG